MNYLTDAMDKLYDPNLSIYDIQKAQELLQEFNDSIPDSAFVAHEVIGVDVLTAADIAILPYVEKWLAIEECIAS